MRGAGYQCLATGGERLNGLHPMSHLRHQNYKHHKNRLTVLFGGTFDPVHYGHLRTAAEVCDHLAAEDFRIVPTGRPGHRDAPKASPAHRLAMLRLALAPWPDLRIDDRELRRDGPSWTVETLESLRAELGAERPIVVCVGQDAANALHTWHRWSELPGLAHLLLLQRPGSPQGGPAALQKELAAREVHTVKELLAAPAGRLLRMQTTQLEISSTEIRHQLAVGQNPRFLLPQPVLAHIHRHGLYDSDGEGAQAQ